MVPWPEHRNVGVVVPEFKWKSEKVELQKLKGKDFRLYAESVKRVRDSGEDPLDASIELFVRLDTLGVPSDVYDEKSDADELASLLELAEQAHFAVKGDKGNVDAGGQ